MARPFKVNTTWGGTFNYSYNTKTKYFVFGEEVEIDAAPDSELAITISTLNVLGKPFYEQLKKQNITFPDVIEEVIQRNLLTIDRENKIDQIIK